jgi:dipeptidase E
MPSPHIVALGAHPADPMLEYVTSLARGPRILWVGTATMESPAFTVQMYDRLHRYGDVSFLRFHPWPPEDLRGFTLGHDLVVVGGGNTANMLAIWRVHGFDRILREAWESGVVLTGWSAGMICWFEAGVTDSFGPQLEGMRDGLGFLPGSACPHYDGEELRRPIYRRLVDEDGFPSGLAADDATGLHYVGTELHEVVTTTEGSQAYRVTPDGEEPLPARLLG